MTYSDDPGKPRMALEDIYLPNAGANMMGDSQAQAMGKHMSIESLVVLHVLPVCAVCPCGCHLRQHRRLPSR